MPFFVPVEGDYQVWLAGSQLDSPETSPLSWNLDSSEWTRVAGLSPTGDPYGPGFRWTRLGTARLVAGKHVIRIRAEAPAPASGQWSAALDALLVMREAFVPDGIRRPALR